jgi:hypothetical protein
MVIPLTPAPEIRACSPSSWKGRVLEGVPDLKSGLSLLPVGGGRERP